MPSRRVFAPSSKLSTCSGLNATGVVPVFYHADLETAKNVVAAVSKGGCKIVEFVNRGDHAFEVFSDLERHFAKADPTLILGAGIEVAEGNNELFIFKRENGDWKIHRYLFSTSRPRA